MTAQELKNSILHLAVQGKLVPQETRDESATELLRRINKYRANAIAERKLFIDKKHTADVITEEDIPYDLPSSWIWVRFADIVAFNSGKTPARQDTTCWSNGIIPWLSIADMVADGITYNTKYKVSKQAITSCFAEKISPAGTVIMSFKLTIGKMSILGVDAVHNEAIISIFPTAENQDAEVLKKYLFKILPIIAVKGDSKNAVKGKTLNATSISNLMIPLPPLAEQERIVAKIEELLPYVEEYDKTEKRLQKLNDEFPDKLRKSILQQAVQGKLTERHPDDEPACELLRHIRKERDILQKSKIAKKSQASESISEDEIPFDIPDTWEWVNLGWLCQKVGAGSTPKGGSAVYVSQGIKFLREQNVYDDGLHLDDVAYITEETHMDKLGSHVEAKDILMNITGGSIGRNSMVPDDFDTANTNQHVLIIRLVNKELRHYLHYCFSAPVILNQMFKKQVGDKPGLSATKVENFLVPLPPLAEQKRIVARVEELLAVCDKLK